MAHSATSPAKVSLDPAKKTATLADVARLAGTAKSTASLAINGKGWVSPATRDAVLRAAQELKFEMDVQAQRLSTGGPNNNIALFSLELDDGMGAGKLQFIQFALRQKGFAVPIYGLGYQNALSEQVELLREVRRQKPRALIYNTLEMHAEIMGELARYQEAGGILITYDAPLGLDCDAVIFDRADNTYRAARHLLKLGHRRLGLYIIGQQALHGPRLEGFRRAMAEFGAPLQPEWMFPCCSPSLEADGADLATQFLQMPPGQRPSGICIVNDYVAMAFIGELRAAGVFVPHDVSVVGHDNRPLARYALPPITTVTQPFEAIANRVVELLLERLDGFDGPARHETFYGELILRHSTLAALTA